MIVLRVLVYFPLQCNYLLFLQHWGQASLTLRKLHRLYYDTGFVPLTAGMLYAYTPLLCTSHLSCGAR